MPNWSNVPKKGEVAVVPRGEHEGKALVVSAVRYFGDNSVDVEFLLGDGSTVEIRNFVPPHGDVCY